MKDQSRKTKRLIAAGTLAVAAAGWLGYGIFKVVTAPVTIWTTSAELVPLVAAGGATIKAVTVACCIGPPTL